MRQTRLAGLLTIAIVALAVAGVAWADEPAPQPNFRGSPAAQEATATYQGALTKADADYHAAQAAARKVYIAKLKAELVEQTKKGNLDLALQIRNAVQQLETGTGDVAVQPQQQTDTNSALVDKKAFVGRWVRADGNGNILNDDGTVSNDGHDSEGKWTVKKVAAIEVRWEGKNSGWIDTFIQIDGRKWAAAPYLNGSPKGVGEVTPP